MAGETEPFNQYKKANEAYHEAVQTVLLDGGLPVNEKAKFATAVQRAFNAMEKAKSEIQGHYEPEEKEAE